MKKIVLSGLMFAMILSSTYSCQKEVDLNANKTTIQENTKNSISDITADYILGQSKLPESKINPFWRRVIGADLTAAGVGALAGMGVGAAAAGVGAIPGAIVGGLFAGAGASFTAAGISAPENTGGVGTTYNSNNPYDFAGTMHYQIMRDCQANPDTYTLNDEINMSTYKTEVFNIASGKYTTINSYKELFVDKDYKTMIYDAQNVSDISDFFVTTNSKLSGLSSRAISTLNSYSDALDLTNNPSDFITYSISAESSVLSDTNLNDKEKAIILSYMSTARIALGYYL